MTRGPHVFIIISNQVMIIHKCWALTTDGSIPMMRRSLLDSLMSDKRSPIGQPLTNQGLAQGLGLVSYRKRAFDDLNDYNMV